jgi:Tannase-like family of unknown function (DUF6351)
MPRIRRSFGRLAALMASASLFAWLLPSTPARASVATGISDPPPYASQPVPADAVVADPFSQSAPGLEPGQIEMTTLSAPPSLVSGGRARIEIRGLAPDDVLAVTRDGTDVSDAFSPVGGPSITVQGVVTGLEGSSLVVATATGQTYGTRTATLQIINHPVSGPVISGEQQVPFVCETAESGMGAPSTDGTCSVPTTYHWYYRSAITQQFTQLANPADAYPPDTAVTIVNGKIVPFVVRVESSVINRSITHIAVLDDPHARGATLASFDPVEWNRDLVYVFGENCGRGHHQGVLHETDVLGDQQSFQNAFGEEYALSATAGDLPDRLGAGYMIAMSSLTTLQYDCNPLLSAETAMMVKEHITDDYGVVAHTIGMGGSGGAIQQHLVANNYPGLIDGSTMIVSFPDMATVLTTMVDCHLLERAFHPDLTISTPSFGPVSLNVPISTTWDPIKQRAVTGMATADVCADWDASFYPLLRPTCDEKGANGQFYVDPSSGTRCSVQDEQRNTWGIDPATGAANLPYDNVGVQYGLEALRSGAISPEEFVTLNREIGGIDVNGTETPSRTSADPAVVEIAYATGQLTGRGALDAIPIIDQAVFFLDYTPGLDVHDQARPWEQRARLDATYGTHANQAIFSVAPLPSRTVDVMEGWLEAVDGYMARHPGVSRAEAISRARPSDAADQCRVLVVGVPDTCTDGVARASSPRQAAGGPLSEDTLKCQLKPLSDAERADYPTMTDPQWSAIKETFPDGVCDYSKPPVGVRARTQTWLSWGDGAPGTTPVEIPWIIARSPR